jgi:hypothetical protein
MNDNDNGSNASLSRPLGLVLGQNQIQEATVVSTGYSGQFRGTADANVNYLTKSGGNVFHGNTQSFGTAACSTENKYCRGPERPSRSELAIFCGIRYSRSASARDQRSA